MPESSKKSFILYTDFNEVLEKLSDEQAGKVFKALLEWQSTGTIENPDTLTDLITTPIITQFKRDESKWQEIRIKRSEAGKKGGRPRLDKAKKANASFDKQKKQSKAKKAVTVNVTVNDTVKESKARARTPDEVIEYCKSIDLPESDGEATWDKWEGNGHKNSGRSMRCWKSTIRSWKANGYMPSQKETGTRSNQLSFAEEADNRKKQSNDEMTSNAFARSGPPPQLKHG